MNFLNEDSLKGRKSNDDFYLSWRRDLSLFVYEALGVNGQADSTGKMAFVTKQQKAACDEISRLRLLKDMDIQLRDAEQRKIAAKWGISIMSGQGVGKDTLLAWVMIWYLTLFENCKILATAPTSSSLQSVLWSEVAKWLNRRYLNGEYCALPIVRDVIEMQARKIFHKFKGDDCGKVWFAEARTVGIGGPENQGETLAGRHEDYMLYVVDEASGVPDPVYKPIVGGMTGRCNFAILAFNPTKNNGFAYKTQYHDENEKWVKIRWNAEDSELIQKENLEAMEKEYGRESNMYRIRVLGLPPISDDDAVIPHAWVEDAMERDIGMKEYDPVVIGMDCAGKGECKAVILVRKGKKVIGIHKRGDLDTQEQAMWLLEKIEEYDAVIAYVDCIGWGAGVYDRARRLSDRITGVRVSDGASRNQRYHRLRDELWWKTRELFERGLISIPKDDDFAMELSSVRMRPGGDANGKFKVESKQEMRARNVKSPDMADALIITFYRDDDIYWDQVQDAYDKEDFYAKSKGCNSESRHSWMRA